MLNNLAPTGTIIADAVGGRLIIDTSTPELPVITVRPSAMFGGGGGNDYRIPLAAGEAERMVRILATVTAPAHTKVVEGRINAYWFAGSELAPVGLTFDVGGRTVGLRLSEAGAREVITALRVLDAGRAA